MDGTIIDLGKGKYRCRISFVNEYGKRVQKSKTFTASGMKEARRLTQQFREDCMSNVIPAELLTLNDLYNSYERYHMSTLAPTTVQGYKDTWKTLIEFKDTKLARIKPNMISEMLNAAPPKTRRRKYIFQLLSGMFNYGLRAELITYNPCANVKTPEYTAPEKHTLTAEQKERIEAQLEFEPLKYQVIYKITASLGLRRGEVAALKWEDIDLDTGTVKICRAAANVTGGMIVKATKTKRSTASLPLTQHLTNVLKHYKTYSELDKKNYGIDTDFLFYQSDGSVINLNTITHWFKSLCTRLGIEGVTFHSIRHTVATNLLQNGVDIATVAAILRDNVSTVAAVYVHSDEDVKRKAIEGLS